MGVFKVHCFLVLSFLLFSMFDLSMLKALSYGSTLTQARRGFANVYNAAVHFCGWKSLITDKTPFSVSRENVMCKYRVKCYPLSIFVFPFCLFQSVTVLASFLHCLGLLTETTTRYCDVRIYKIAKATHSSDHIKHKISRRESFRNRTQRFFVAVRLGAVRSNVPLVRLFFWLNRGSRLQERGEGWRK